MSQSDEVYKDHEDEAPNDPNAPHGVNTEEEMIHGSDDEPAS